MTIVGGSRDSGDTECFTALDLKLPDGETPSVAPDLPEGEID